MNETIMKFGYPASLIADYAHWVVLLRPAQATLGALILACKDDATAFSQISPGAFQEFSHTISDIETALSRAFSYDKINYLMLMMVDPHVHFHVLPRYARSATFEGISFEDPGWPKTPDLAHKTDLSANQTTRLIHVLKSQWVTSEGAT